MSKQHLQDMLEAIIAGKEDEAKAAFHTYVTEKVRGLVSEAKEGKDSKEEVKVEVKTASKEDKGSKESKESKETKESKKSKED